MDDNTSIQYRRRLAQITGIDSFSKNTIDESAKERERITDIIEDFEVGRKVNVTNPKATPRYEITGKDDTHYHLKGPNDKTMKLPKERIHRVNKVNEEQIDEAAITHVLPKEEVAGHIKRVEDTYNRVHGKDYKIVPLPTEHKLAKTHAGIVFKDRSNAHVSDHLYLWGRTNVEKLHRSIPVNPRKMNEEQIDEVKRSADYLHSTATEDQRAPTLKTYHTAMAKYSDLPPRAAHIKALNDTIDKHGVKNANQHVTKHFYSHMQKHLSDED